MYYYSIVNISSSSKFFLLTSFITYTLFTSCHQFTVASFLSKIHRFFHNYPVVLGRNGSHLISIILFFFGGGVGLGGSEQEPSDFCFFFIDLQPRRLLPRRLQPRRLRPSLLTTRKLVAADVWVADVWVVYASKHNVFNYNCRKLFCTLHSQLIRK